MRSVMTIRHKLGVVAVGVTAMMAACGGGNTATPPQQTAAPASAKTGMKIAVIAKSSTNPVFLSARTGAEAAAREITQQTGVPIEIVWMTPPAEGSQGQTRRDAQAGNSGDHRADTRAQA